MINRFALDPDREDAWTWRHLADGAYHTKGVYTWLLGKEDNSAQGRHDKKEFKNIWNKFVPLKVIVHSWRVFLVRLPTKDELIKCCFCNSYPESLCHVLFECSFAYQTWMEIFHWLGVSTALTQIPKTSLLHFSRLRGKKNGKSLAICIWEYVTWTLWKGRNAKLFNKKEVVEEVKTRSWKWYTTRGSSGVTGVNIDSSSWLQCPKFVL